MTIALSKEELERFRDLSKYKKAWTNGTVVRLLDHIDSLESNRNRMSFKEALEKTQEKHGGLIDQLGKL